MGDAKEMVVRVLEYIRAILDAIPFFLDLLFLSLLLAVAAYGAIKALIEVPDFVKDLWDRFREKDYRLKTTILKVIIAANQTQIIKVRNIRVHTKREKLELDRVPVYGPGPTDKDVRAHVEATHYSVPGRSFVVPRPEGPKFQIDFLPDEYLSPHHDHPIVLSYFMDETAETLFNPAGIQAVQPVGTERLTIEVYFPPKCRLKHGTAGVWMIDGVGKRTERLHTKQAPVQYYPQYDFGDGKGNIDFIRAVITKPPQKFDVEFCWEWEFMITNSSLVEGTVGVPYSEQLRQLGGVGSLTWSLSSGSLPPGLLLDPATGTISGMPTKPGTFGFTVQVRDSSSPVSKNDKQLSLHCG
jgi:hypothetical protein